MLQMMKVACCCYMKCWDWQMVKYFLILAFSRTKYPSEVYFNLLLNLG